MSRRPLAALVAAGALAIPASAPAAPVRLVPVPAAVIEACQRAQRQRPRFPVLCPTLLPRASRSSFAGLTPSPLGAAAYRGTLEIGYDAEGDSSGHPLAFNRPDRFLHLVLGPADQGIPAGARPARLGGRTGLLLPATPGTYAGPYFANHVRFLFQENGVRYVATLHTFGEQPTEQLLARILHSLRPPRRIKPLQPPAGQPALAIPQGPLTMLAGGDGTLWLTSRGPLQTGLTERLVRIDRTAGRVEPIGGLGHRELRVAVGQDAIWVASTDRDGVGDPLHPYGPPTLARLNPATGRILARYPLGPDRRQRATALAATANALWVAFTRFDRRRQRGTLTRIDPASGLPDATVRVGLQPVALALAGALLWSADARSSTLTAIDPTTAQPVATLQLSCLPAALLTAFGSLWATCPADHAVVRIDPDTRRILARIPLGGPAYALTASTGHLLAPMPDRGTLARIDPRTDTVDGHLLVGGDPIVAATDHDTVWVALNSDGVLTGIPAGA